MATQEALIAVALAAEIEAAVGISPEVRHALQEIAESGAEICKDLAPVGDKAHTLRGGYVDEPGEYRDSFYATTVFVRGRWLGRFGTRNWKAALLEYGTEKMEPRSVVHQAASQLGAQ